MRGTFIHIVLLAVTLSSQAACTGILPGELKPGRITSPGQTNCYTFTAHSGDVVTLMLNITNGPGQFPVLQFHEPDGTWVLSDNDNSIRALVQGLRLTKSGTYTISVRDDQGTETFDYVLTFINFNVDNVIEPGDGNGLNETIVAGQRTEGAITFGDLDRFTFTGQSNEVVAVALSITSGSGRSPVLRVYQAGGGLITILSYPFGIPLATPDGGYLPIVFLGRDGTYSLVVSDDTFTESFRYALTFVKVYGSNATNATELGEGDWLIASGETRHGSIAKGDLDAFSFFAVAGDTIDIRLRKTSGPALGMNLAVHVPGASGDVLSGSTSVWHRIKCRASGTGRYGLLVRGDTPTAEFGYALSVTTSPGPPPSSDPNHPYLAIVPCEGSLILRWPTNAAGFQLESSADKELGPWVPIPPPYLAVGDYYWVTSTSANSARFYRLVRPSP